jgi:DNA polymerase I
VLYIHDMSKKIYIIDGHSHLYASFYAIRRLTSPSGEPTNATYGMTSVILKILRDHKPDSILIVFDPPGKTYRDTLYTEYKANRPPMPDDLVVQVRRIQEVLSTMGVPVAIIPGYEADDIIAYVTHKAREAGMEVVICSKDKDLEQLLGPNVRLYDSTKEKFTDPSTLRTDKGLTPEQVTDYLALMGDAVDNVPGIPGVGPKTAQKLIQDFGTIDNMLVNPENLPQKIKDYLANPENVEKLMLSRRLVTLLDEVPLEFKPEDWTQKIPDEAALAKLFTELGFTRFLQNLGVQSPPTPAVQETPASPAKPQETRFEQIKSLEQLKDLAGLWSKKEFLSVDTETTGIDPMLCELVGLSFAVDSTTGWYLPVKTTDAKHLDFKQVLPIIKPLLENPAIKKIGQNLKYDILVLRNAGIELAGIYFDTMIASYILDPSRPSHGMDYLAQELLQYKTIKISELIGKGPRQLTLDQVSTERVTDYSAEDALITFRLFEVLASRLNLAGLDDLFQKIEMPLLSVLVDMEYEGVSINTQKLKELSRTLADKTHKIADEVFRLAGHIFNIESPKQLGQVLFDELKLPVSKLTKTGRSTDVGVLEELAWKHPLPKLILEYRQYIKLKNTYIDRLPEMINPRTNKIHASFNQTITATGRLSSSEPNLQNIPIRSEIGKQIRSAFVPSDPQLNCLVTCDYSQIELRLLAHLSGDKNLIDAFRNDRDIHAFVAAQVFGIDINLVSEDQRRVAKTVNFGIIYGQSAHGLAQTLGISRTEAQKFINDYFDRYPQVKTFINDCIEKARQTGVATTMMDRRRTIPDINSKTPATRAFAERTAVNTVVQGSAADMIKIAMINIHREIRADVKLLIQVHDELVFEVPKPHADAALEKIVHLMSTALPLSVPVKVDAACGENWLESK